MCYKTSNLSLFSSVFIPPFSLSFSSHFLLYLQSVGASANDAALLGNTTKTQLNTVILNKEFCTKIIFYIDQYNVTALSKSDQLAAIRGMCGSTVRAAKFDVSIVPIQFNPTFKPTSIPTRLGPIVPFLKTPLVSIQFLGYMFILFIIAFLRCCPVLVGCCTSSDDMSKAHLYDILVILNDENEAVFQNIRHEDIIYFRRYRFFLFYIVSYYTLCY